MTVAEALRHGRAVLEAAGVDSPGLDARLLLADVTGLSREALLREPSQLVDTVRYQAVLDRRATREPMALILGWQEFWSLPFLVSPATLIPRPDSETLVEAAVSGRPAGVRSVLDLGTGTGCLLLAVLSERPDAWGVGVDRSPAAAALAAANARALGFSQRASMLCADWASPLAGRFDLVLSNPPYVERDAISALMPEVARFEPASALDGGPDGLDAYRALLAGLPALLAPGGLAVFELGAGQADAVAALARSAGFARVRTRADLGGMARAMLIEAP